MKIKNFFLTICFIFCCTTHLFAQEEELLKNSDSIITLEKELNPLAPSTAAFYSAILPGLGQAYNEKYWKIPIVYAALGTSTFFYIDNNNKYNQYRDAFKLMESGKPHEFDGLNGNIELSRDALIRAQTRYKEDRDLSLLITAAFYILQIVEASVNAHLASLNTNDDITLKPHILINPINNKTIGGLVLTYNF